MTPVGLHRAGEVCTGLRGVRQPNWVRIATRMAFYENGVCDQCGQGGLVFLALVGPAVHLLGDSAPRWPAGSPAQWQRPRMWICVGPRDPATPHPHQAKPGLDSGYG